MVADRIDHLAVVVVAGTVPSVLVALVVVVVVVVDDNRNHDYGHDALRVLCDGDC